MAPVFESVLNPVILQKKSHAAGQTRQPPMMEPPPPAPKRRPSTPHPIRQPSKRIKESDSALDELAERFGRIDTRIRVNTLAWGKGPPRPSRLVMACWTSPDKDD